MRGEQAFVTTILNRECGSSPRAWGTDGQRRERLGPGRFIPTCVGNSAEEEAAAPPVTGSSPRAWGTDQVRPVLPPVCRFIPTCVGNRTSNESPLLFVTVHPHVRGEQVVHSNIVKSRFGSSPRAWGTVLSLCTGRLRHRFIPTCVGNSLSYRTRRRTVPVHPHVRGEQHEVMLLTFCAYGSSPRAWGTAFSCALVIAVLRFIPTCVGNRWPLLRR